MTLSRLLLAGRYSQLTKIFSMTYLWIFFPIVLVVYAVMPKRTKKYVLLGFSYIFSWLFSGALTVYLLLSTLSVHYFGIWIDRLHRLQADAVKEAERDARKAIKASFLKKKRGIVALAVVLHIGILVALKYTGFFAVNINTLLRAVGLTSIQFTVPSIALPIGISFYTLQAVSYIVDVYRGTIPADDNLLRLALFMSFYPQIIEGPICRYADTAQSLWEAKPIEFENLKFGIQRIAFGMMKKVVVADRLNSFISNVFAEPDAFRGGIVAIAAACYTVQLYMDFSGTIDAMIGTAQIFGVRLPENFRRPFFSKTISEFWQRWHITLGTWFKDYIFYPITMSKPMKALTSASRKKIGNYYGPLVAGSVALLCVWFCNGLWHGAGWNYVCFGLYHFVMILCGSLVQPLATKLNKALHIRTESLWFSIFRALRTTLIVLVGEVFFRADSVGKALSMLRRIVTDFRFGGLSAYLAGGNGIDAKDFIICGVTIAIVFVIGLLQERGVRVRESLNKKNIVLRWAILYALILFIAIFGAYGSGYTPIDPMYANF